MNDRNRRGKWAGLKQIAIYGKGGIGKSTISANISAAMALSGCSVMQIGCDPKQDSTRLLLEGRRTATVLDYLRATEPGARSLAAVVHTGFAGVACVEAGGPEPGVGCAGRGILSALDLLDSLGIGTPGHDVVLYDVLGDVVCGGFAVPLRERYADFIYIVTSGEFMSLYAANNILRGVRNFEEGGFRMAGIILNRRGLTDEDERVRRFADAVRLPLVAAFPRSQAIGAAEQLGKTVVQAFPEGDEAAQFQALAQVMLHFATPLPAHPLAPDDLESIVLNKTTCRVFPEPISPFRLPGMAGEASTCPHSIPQTPVVQARHYRSKSVNRHEVLHGCAFNGAVHTLLQLSDAVVIAHGPRSCAYISGHGMAAAVRRAANKYGRGCEGWPCGTLRSTEMDERVAIFGGSDALARQLRVVARDSSPKVVFVVTTCAAGIIGDDLQVAVETARDALPEDVPVISVTADGDINGDYMQGVIDAMIAVADRYIDRSVAPEADMVNIVAEKNLATNTEANYLRVLSLLDVLGLKVNCRFIRNCSVEQVTGFLRGRVNLLAAADLCGRTIRDYLHHRYGAAFLPSAFPVGFTATAQWLRELAEFFGKEAEAEALIEREQERYEETLDRYRPSLKGKRVFIVTQSYQIDWVLDLVFDLGMEIVKVGVLSSAWDEDFVTRYRGRFPLALSYTREERDKEIHSLRPDLTLINAMWRGQPDDFRVDAIHILPDVGFESALELAQHWQRLMKLPPKEGWRYDL